MNKNLKAAALAVPLLTACVLLNGQVTRSRTLTLNTNPIPTSPASVVSQFQVEGALITQNNYVPPIAVANVTGNFGSTARWNSMGNLSTPNQILNGFRTQTNGRALVTGHSIPTAGTVSNPFIQWIGNSTATGGPILPGNLEFKFAVSPTSITDVRLFTMAPNSLGTGGNSYAENGLVGQLASGAFGNVFGTTDRWFGAGLFNLTGGTTVLGSRNQLDGTFLTHNIARNAAGSKEAIIGFGGNMAASPQADIQFLKIKYYDNPTLDPITGGDEIVRIDRKFKTFTVGYNNLASTFIYPARLAAIDGSNPSPSPLVNDASSGGITDGIAVYGLASGFSNTAPGPVRYAAGVVGDVFNSAAAGGIVDPNFPTNTYAVLGIAADRINPGTTATKFAGFFIGDLGYTGAFWQPSDRKLKDKIETETTAMDKIMQLNPVHYEYKTKEYSKMSLAGQLQHGFISQELEKVFPEMVKQINMPDFTGKEGENFRGINYMQLIPVLTKAIQELNTKVSDLENKLSAEKEAGVLAAKAVNEADALSKGYSLTQNTPNPFSANTTVTYSVPENTKQALLAIFDLNGKMIAQYNLQQGKGRQQIISANTLNPGMYIYTLLADGVELMSKKMIVIKN
jgi:hypothetical protein